MKKILIINGHPDKESFNYALSEAYKRGAEQSGAEIKEINIRELNFNPNLQFGYRKRMELEPDLIDSQEKILWSEHIVFVYPVWWGSFPAIMKGFFDRTFLAPFSYKKRENSMRWDKMLKGRSARVICTLDQPGWTYWLFFGRPSHNSIKKCTLNFTGVKPVKVTSIGPIRLSKKEFRQKWLKKVERLGLSNK
jgi:putative NADPH-quinone reductase